MESLTTTNPGKRRWTQEIEARLHAACEPLRPVLTALNKAGFACCIGGGFLRDVACGVAPKDIDIFVSYWPEDQPGDTYVDGGKSLKLYEHVNVREHFVSTVRDAFQELSGKDPEFTLLNLSYFSDGEVTEVVQLTESVGGFPVEVILLTDTNLGTYAMVNRFDFGLGKLAYDIYGLYITGDFIRDWHDQALTLVRCHSPQRSLRRYDRLAAKYPGYTLRCKNYEFTGGFAREYIQELKPDPRRGFDL